MYRKHRFTIQNTDLEFFFFKQGFIVKKNHLFQTVCGENIEKEGVISAEGRCLPLN